MGSARGCWSKRRGSSIHLQVSYRPQSGDSQQFCGIRGAQSAQTESLAPSALPQHLRGWSAISAHLPRANAVDNSLYTPGSRPAASCRKVLISHALHANCDHPVFIKGRIVSGFASDYFGSPSQKGGRMRTLVASLRKANGHLRSMPPELPGAVPYQTAMLDDAGMAASRALGWDPLHSRRTGGKLGVPQRPRMGKAGKAHSP